MITLFTAMSLVVLLTLSGWGAIACLFPHNHSED